MTQPFLGQGRFRTSPARAANATEHRIKGTVMANTRATSAEATNRASSFDQREGCFLMPNRSLDQDQACVRLISPPTDKALLLKILGSALGLPLYFRNREMVSCFGWKRFFWSGLEIWQISRSNKGLGHFESISRDRPFDDPVSQRED